MLVRIKQKHFVGSTIRYHTGINLSISILEGGHLRKFDSYSSQWCVIEKLIEDGNKRK